MRGLAGLPKKIDAHASIDGSTRRRRLAARLSFKSKAVGCMPMVNMHALSIGGPTQAIDRRIESISIARLMRIEAKERLSLESEPNVGHRCEQKKKNFPVCQEGLSSVTPSSNNNENKRIPACVTDAGMCCR